MAFVHSASMAHFTAAHIAAAAVAVPAVASPAFDTPLPATQTTAHAAQMPPSRPEGAGSVLHGDTAMAAQEVAAQEVRPQTPDQTPNQRQGGVSAGETSLERSDADQQELAELQARDREVRAHEAAHARVGGEFAGRPGFTFRTGPDGRQYAVAGEVSIDRSPISGDPEATIQKLEQVIRAALAPVSPSDQDRAVAASARADLQAARAEVARADSQTDAVPVGADPADIPAHIQKGSSEGGADRSEITGGLSLFV